MINYYISDGGFFNTNWKHARFCATGPVNNTSLKFKRTLSFTTKEKTFVKEICAAFGATCRFAWFSEQFSVKHSPTSTRFTIKVLNNILRNMTEKNIDLYNRFINSSQYQYLDLLVAGVQENPTYRDCWFSGKDVDDYPISPLTYRVLKDRNKMYPDVTMSFSVLELIKLLNDENLNNLNSFIHRFTVVDYERSTLYRYNTQICEKIINLVLDQYPPVIKPKPTKKVIKTAKPKAAKKGTTAKRATKKRKTTKKTTTKTTAAEKA